jgi:predicted regulator of Ras-like GTPase activity (Roadblock/LC7/MglB family)
MDRIEGSAAAAILGVDGIMIERSIRDLDPALDAELVAIEFTNLLRRAVVTASDTELGDLTEMIVATDLVTFLLRPITSEYFLLLALNPGGNVGRARFELRRTQLELKEEFTI